MPHFCSICLKILIPDIMGDQPTEETQFVVDEVILALYAYIDLTKAPNQPCILFSNLGNKLAV